MKNKYIIVFIIFFLFILSANTAAITAQDVINNAINTFENQYDGIDDITIVTNNYTTYKKRVDKKDKWMTRRVEETGNGEMISLYDGEFLWQKTPYSSEIYKTEVEYNPLETIMLLKEMNPDYLGKEKVNGIETHVLKINKENTKKILKSYMNPEEAEKYEAEGKVFIDGNNWLLRKMEMKVSNTEVESSELTMTYIYKDYEKVKNLHVAYTTVMRREGMESMMNLTEEEKKQLEEQLEKYQEKLEEAPEEQKEMIKNMVGPQLEQIKEALGMSEEVIEVQEVKINQGLEDDLFNPDKL